LNTRTTAAGLLLIVIALVLGGVQDLHAYNIYVGISYKWYFYGILGAILIVGMLLAAYGALGKRKPLTAPKVP